MSSSGSRGRLDHTRIFNHHYLYNASVSIMIAVSCLGLHGKQILKASLEPAGLLVEPQPREGRHGRRTAVQSRGVAHWIAGRDFPRKHE